MVGGLGPLTTPLVGRVGDREVASVTWHNRQGRKKGSGFPERHLHLEKGGGQDHSCPSWSQLRLERRLSPKGVGSALRFDL